MRNGYNKKVHKFADSKKVGDVGEDLVAVELDRLGFRYTRPKSGPHKVDFVLLDDAGKKFATLEVKYDKASRKTKNLAFEIISSRRNVGWALEPYADFFLILTDSDVFFFSKEDIIELTSKRENLFFLKTVFNKGYVSIIMAIPIKDLDGFRYSSIKEALMRLR